MDGEAALWPSYTFLIAIMLIGTILLVSGLRSFQEFRKLKLLAAQQEDVRQLIRRYEQLAENTLDAQQRAAADVAELRARAASIEQILRTVE